MTKIFATTLLAIMTVAAAFSQELRLVVSDRPLNTVVNSLGVEVSFDDSALSEYNVNVSRTFGSAEEALEYLLKGKPFELNRFGNVWVITPKKGIKADNGPEPTGYFRYTGTVLDSETGEKMPYGYLHTGNSIYPCDQAGGFSFRRETDGPVKIKVSYLGYQPVDTVIYPGYTALNIVSNPVRLENVTVNPSPLSMLMQVGFNAGEIRINHNIARFIPGSPDNSVFSLLRMMPGVRASGEPSEDLIVWGSGSGESKIVFDGYTLFGMKNYNDHISSVNPYLVKDIRLFKGGYNAGKGGRTGPIAEISGIDGDLTKPLFKAMISNYTANLFASVPVAKRSVLTAAYRQTFYNLYNDKKYDISGEGKNAEAVIDIYVRPRYSFRDGNLKFSGSTRSGDSYYVSLYGADDRFKFAVGSDGEYSVDAKEKSFQAAGAAGYEKKWTNGSLSTAKVCFSIYSTGIDNVTSIGEGAGYVLVSSRTDNSIGELSAGVDHGFSIGKTHSLKAGVEWTLYVNHLNNRDHDVSVPSVFITDNILLGRLSLSAGARVDFPWDGNAGIQPRISARYSITEKLAASASWGSYRQFISKIPYQYSTGHYEMIWSLSDSTFMRSSQAVAGLAFSNKGILLSLEGFRRQTDNGLYFLDDTVFYSGKTIVGMDFFAKKDFGRHNLFASYSLTGSRRPASETTHEIKAGGLAAAGNFYFSANFVYGTGFSYVSAGGHSHGERWHGAHAGSGENGSGNGNGTHSHSDDGDRNTYSRLDVAVTYRLQKEKWRLQCGVSLLNVFDTRNVKYSYRLNDRTNVTNIYTKATAFTPVLFAEILF